jgi:hypothetical protein
MTTLKIYNQPLFKGDELNFDQEDFDLSIINDISDVGSIEVAPGYLALACLEPNFKSPAFLISDLWTKEGSFEKKKIVQIKSLKLVRARTVSIYEHQDFNGESVVLEFSNPDLRTINFNDKISSVLCGGISCICYEHVGFNGESMHINNYWNTPSATDHWSDFISSVYLNL